MRFFCEDRLSKPFMIFGGFLPRLVHLMISVRNSILLCLGTAIVLFAWAGGNAPVAEATDAGGQPKYALLVGITKYKSPSLNQIDGCENNVPLLAQTLIDSYGFKKSDVHLLMNEQASKSAIISEFRSHLIENARRSKREGKEAVVLYYFCGHGSQYADQDGDENDGLDETFVAYDSRTGGTPDILDDEIDDLKAELRPYTTNTTLIFESCHSGTGSRGDDSDRDYVSEEADQDTQKYPPYKRKYPPSTDADAGTYTEIAASASINTAKSETKAYCNCDKPSSLMTKALVEALNRANYTTTYRSLVREISTAVGERSPQDPQVEGNRDTLLFGGDAKRTKPYIEIERLLPNDQILIRAGSVHGVRAGSQVAIYSSASTNDAGDSGWLTNGVVKEVRNFQSVVQVPSTKENERSSQINIASHVVLTSPVFGGGPVLVSLDVGDAGLTRTKTVDQLAVQVEEQIKADKLVDDQMISIIPSATLVKPVGTAASGILRLRRGPFGTVFPQRFRDRADMPKPTACTVTEGKVAPENIPTMDPGAQVYYLDDGTPGGLPLYGRFFLPDDKTAPAEIVRLIRNYALRTNLESLANNASTLPSQVSVTLMQIANAEVVQNCNDGQLGRGLKSPPKATDLIPVKNGRLPIGAVFNFRVKNISGEIRRQKDQFAAGEPLYITAIYLLTNGDIEVIYPRLGAKDPLGDGVEKTIGGYIASKPLGTEHLILIVSKKFVDFGFYESTGTSRDAQSPLERLLRQSGTRSRDAGTIVPDEPDQWGVVRVDLDIVDQDIKR
jgi:hypothetical protein